MTIALFLSGCASSRRSEGRSAAAQSTDSTHRTALRETLRTVTTEAVPKAAVTLTLSADSLRRLPEGASYRARNGRASVEVRKGAESGTVVVYAECDSLRRTVETCERRLESAETATKAATAAAEESSESRKPHGGAWTGAPLLLLGGCAAALGCWLARRRT